MKRGDRVRYRRKRTAQRTTWSVVSVDEEARTCVIRCEERVKRDVNLDDLEVIPEEELSPRRKRQ